MITTTTPEIGGAAPALPADLLALMARMRLPHMRKAAPEALAVAKAQRWDPAEVLRTLLAEEVTGRERSALATRRAAAGFPTGRTFDAWNPEASSIPAPTQQALRTLAWVHRRENLVVCGPSGTGKTFLLEALGQQAVEAELHVAWLRLEDLGVLLRRHRGQSHHPTAQSRTDHRRSMPIPRLCRGVWRGRGDRQCWARHSHRLSRKARTLSGGR